MLRSTLILLLATAVQATNYYDMIIMAFVNSTLTGVECGGYEDVVNENIRKEFLAHGVVTLAPSLAPVTAAPVTAAPVSSPPSPAPATRRQLRSRDLALDCYDACIPYRRAYGKGYCYKYVTECPGGRRKMREVTRELSSASHAYCVKGQYAMLDAIIKTAFDPIVNMSVQCQAFFLQPIDLKCMQPV